jgi:hypothetical protein
VNGWVGWVMSGSADVLPDVDCCFVNVSGGSITLTQFI